MNASPFREQPSEEAPVAGAQPARTESRIAVLDVLRGIALLGMFLVHFNMFSSGGGAADGVYQKLVALLLEERFWAMSAVLFGVGFAVQLRRADASGQSFVRRYMRRLAALAVFGFLAHALFGFNVLLGYAAWGVPLLLVRRWSARALFIGVLVSAMSGSLYFVARAGYGVATRGEAGYRAAMTQKAAAQRAFFQANRQAQESENYRTVIGARLDHMRWFYAQWWSFLPVNTLTLFLLGVLAFRLRLFERPHEHRWLIVAVAAFGILAWTASTWFLPRPAAALGTPMVRNIFLSLLGSGFGLVRGMWLAFAYIGGVLLIVARRPGVLDRLAFFGWTGRMALTNYMVQIAILDFAFSPYALGLSVTPLAGALLGLALFAANAWFSRWWLSRYRYGPLEWIWRTVTCAEWLRLAASSPLVQRASPL